MQFPPEVLARLQIEAARKRAEVIQRQQQQGKGRPIISWEVGGLRFVEVGNTRCSYPANKWVSFQDFLLAWSRKQFGGAGWWKAQSRLPEDRKHPFCQWVDRTRHDQQIASAPLGRVRQGPMTAAVRSWLTLGYDLYLVRHNLTPTEHHDRLFKRLLKRLRDPASFWGALNEANAMALMAVAGFEVRLEDEKAAASQGLKPVEFTAKSRSTGRLYSVEVKGRQRRIERMTTDGEPLIDDTTLNLGNKLREALEKDAAHERIVFIDVGLSRAVSEGHFREIIRVGEKRIRDLEHLVSVDGQPAPPAYVIITNKPYHRNFDASSSIQAFATGFKIPDFGSDAQHKDFRALVASRERHADILGVIQAMDVQSTIPVTFNGQNPALAFLEEPAEIPQIGNWYLVPNEEGIQVPVFLEDVTANEDGTEMFFIGRTEDGKAVTGRRPMTAIEIEAYRLHPQTVFGTYKHREGRARLKDVVDAFDFFHECYSKTPRERLLEFMKNAPNIEELRKLDQKDLAIIYAERMAWGAEKRRLEGLQRKAQSDGA